MIDTLVELLDVKPEEKEEVKESLQDAFRDQHIHFIKDYGFFTWREVRKNNNLYIYIENLYIVPEKRSKGNLLHARKFLRSKYSGVKFYYYHSKKHNKFHYERGEK